MKAFPARASAWTGGQYSLFRAALATYLLAHFVALLPWAPELFSSAGALPEGGASPLLHLFPNLLALADDPIVVTALVAAAIGLCVPLLIGWWDRAAALGLYYVWACLFGRNPLIANPGLPYVGLLLVTHALTPPAPWGSLARARLGDSGATWRVPVDLERVLWILMAVGYAYSGITKLVSPSWLDGSAFGYVLAGPLARPTWLRALLLDLPSPLISLLTWAALGAELAFAPLALFRRTRPFAWLALLAMHLGLITLIDFADLSMGMVLLHLRTFDPSWIGPARRDDGTAAPTVFYDGTCGLCHGFVRFALAEDRSGTTRFAPLDSEAFRAAYAEAARARLPDSIVVMPEPGRALVRSQAIVAVCAHLGGLWRVLAAAARLVPRPLADLVYDGVAHVRRRVFARPAAACPVLPPELRSRFLG